MGKSRDRATRSGSDPVNIGTSRLSVDSGNIKVTAQDGTTFKKIFAEEIQVGSGNNRVIFKRGSDGKAEFQSTTDGGGSTSNLTVGGSTTVTNPSDLPISGNTAGDTILVTSTNNLMIFNGSGWYKIATITNASPTISSAGSATNSFATDGTAVTIEIVASDPEGVTLQYKYQVTTGSLGSTATVTNSATSGGTYSALAANTYSNNRFFKVTPSTNTAHAGTFAITFSVTDGVNTANSSASSFTLQFTVSTSFFFDGTGDKLTLADSDDWYFGTGDFTLEAFIYSKSFANGFNAIMGQWPNNGANANNSFVWETVGSNLNFYTLHGGTTMTSHTGSITLDLNKWYHAVLQRSSGTIKQYINGVEDFSVSNNNNFNNPSSPLTIGGGVTSSTGGTWNGYISNARIVKGSAVYTPGSSGNSTVFDGTGDYLSIAKTTDLEFGSGDFTVEMFAKYTGSSFPGYSCIYSNNLAIQFYLVSGRPEVFLSTTGDGSPGYFGKLNADTAIIGYNGSTVSKNTFYHYAITRSGNTFRLFINGYQAASSTSSNALGVPASLGVSLGAYAAGQYVWEGNISNVRVVKGTALYTSNFTPPTSALTAVSNTKLLTCQNSSGSINDASSSNHSIAANGNAAANASGPFPVFTVPTSKLTNITNTKLLTLTESEPPSGGATTSDVTGKTVTKTGDVAHSYATPFLQGSGGSIYFDGTTDWISGTVAGAGTGDFVMELFVKPITNGLYNSTYNGMVHIRPTAMSSTHTNSGIGFNYQGGGTGTGNFNRWLHLYAGTYDVTYDFINNPALAPPTNSWTHVAYIRTGTLLRLFVGGKGVLKIENDTTDYSTSTHFSLGAYGSTASSMYGYISNFRYIVGSSPYTASGYSTGGSSNFPNGGNDALLAASMPALGTDDWTVECYFKGSHVFLMGLVQVGKDNGSLSIYMNASGNVIVEGNQTGAGYTSATQITTNGWHHVAVVNDGTANTQTTYINGVADPNTGSRSTAYTYTEDTVIIGGRWYSGAIKNTAYRYISNVRITKAKVYTGDFIVPWSPLTNITNCQLLTCQNSSGSITDASSNSLTITSPGNVAAATGSVYHPATGIHPFIGQITPPTSALTAVTNTKLLTAQHSNKIIDASSESVSLTVNGDAIATRLSPF